MQIGYHGSFSKTNPQNIFDEVAKTDNALNSNFKITALAMFVKSSRQYNSSLFSQKQIDEFKSAFEKSNIKSILVHGAYVIKLGSADEEVRKKSYHGLITELQLVNQLGLKLYNFHCGENINKKEGHEYIIFALNKLHDEHPELVKNVHLVIENGTGKTELGKSLEDIQIIIKGIKDPIFRDSIGICIDTCHLYTAWDPEQNTSIDISNPNNFDTFMSKFDFLFGAHKLMGMHLNDSQEPMKSNKDSHASFVAGGSRPLGFIGSALFKHIVNSPRFKNIPLILERETKDSVAELKYLFENMKN